VTRSAVLRLARAGGYEVEEGRYPLEALAESEEAFTSSSVREIMPAVELDGRAIGDGRPGPAARRIQGLLRDAAHGLERFTD